MFDQILASVRGTDPDRVLNSETRRALAQIAKSIGIVFLGLLVAGACLSVPALASILSVPWQFSVIATVLAAVAFPVAVPYAMLRAAGLSHEDVAFVAKIAYREVTAEAIALRGDHPEIFVNAVAHDADSETSTADTGDGRSDADPDTAPDDREDEGEGEGEGESESDTEEVSSTPETKSGDGDRERDEGKNEDGDKGGNERRAVERNAEKASADTSANEAAESATRNTDSRAKAND